MAATWTVHHPARGDDIGPGVRLGDCDASVQLDGGVVVDGAVCGQHAAVTMVGVLIEAEVGHNDKSPAHRPLQRRQRPLGHGVWVPGP